VFAPRERAFWCVGLGATMVVMAGVGFLTGTIPAERRPVASVLFAAGLAFVALAVRWLRRLKHSTDPFTSWPRFLRRELAVLVGMAAFVVVVALLPPEAHETIRGWSRDFINALQTVSPGPGPPRLR
jgi:hypothetical protein